MSQATNTSEEILKRLSQLTTVVENIQRDVQEIKVNQIRTNERLQTLETQISDLRKSTETQLSDLRKSTETQITNIKIQLRSQDNRLWVFLVTLFLAVLGFAAKLILFPNGAV